MLGILPDVSDQAQSLAIGAAEHIHDLGELYALILLVAAGDRMLDAVGHVVTKNLFLGTAQRRPDRRNLGDDIDAVAVVLDHPSEPADLAFDALEPFRDGGFCFWLHD